MKLVSRVLHYICKTSEEPGIWTEKILCDILDLNFFTKRKYLTNENYPMKLRRDIRQTLVELLPEIKISQHAGHENEYYDFKNMSGQTVSIKTNISGNKICSQFIGQTSLQRFNEKTDYNFKTVKAYKNYVLKNTDEMLNLYLKYLFCCDHLLSFRYESGEIIYLKRTDNEKQVQLDENIKLVSTQNIKSWNESMTTKILVDDEYKPLAEFQIHNNRNCIKCRFNLDTIVYLIEKGLIKNVDVKILNLKYKYNIKIAGLMSKETSTTTTTTDTTPTPKTTINRKRKRTIEDEENDRVSVKH
jgi:hypothetical protein